jgi:tol-pal system protein YbgF
MTHNLHQRRALNFTRFAGVLLACALAATPAFAVNKDMVQLQTEVQDLQQAVANLQQSNDERMGVLKDLVQQTADSVNKMSVAIETLQQQMRTQQEASSGKLDQVSGQVQSLNDSLDEVKARLNSLQKSLQSVQDQQQSINAALQNMAQPAGSVPTGTAPAPATNAGPAPVGLPSVPDQAAAVGDNGNVPPDNPFPSTQGPTTTVPAGPAIAPLYKTALGDYEAAKYALATQEFNQVIRSSPADPLAGNAYYYLGEIDYRTGKFSTAVKDYDHVLNGYPGNPKTPVSHLHKGMALLAMKDREGGVAEFRALIQRFPNSPEATQARSKLAGMGLRPTAPRSQ